uniref:Carcinoembryonic antigen-related cell adhesion molecule 1-like n=1 Tax=Oncorhynchus kisutch TaxID=8019 RepID=A0A8C7CJ80_ONCKI
VTVFLGGFWRHDNQALFAIFWTFGDTPVIIVDFLSSEGPVTGEGYVGRIRLDNSTGSLELLKLTIADNGEYRVILRESDLMYLSNTSLNVYETVSGATITITPNPPIIEGGSVTLTCDAAGFNITREWMKDGHPVSSGDDIILSEDKRVLSIKKRTDSGEYLCRVSNHVSSENASDTVNVIYGPDGMEIKGPTKIEVGQKFTLTCSAYSNPPTSYTWMHNETEIPGHSPEFTKEKSEYSDSGDYTCSATNDVTGNKTSVVHKLSVKAEGSPSVVVITGTVIIVLLVVEVAVSKHFIQTSVFSITAGNRQYRLCFHNDLNWSEKGPGYISKAP